MITKANLKVLADIAAELRGCDDAIPLVVADHDDPFERAQALENLRSMRERLVARADGILDGNDNCSSVNAGEGLSVHELRAYFEELCPKLVCALHQRAKDYSPEEFVRAIQAISGAFDVVDELTQSSPTAEVDADALDGVAAEIQAAILEPLARSK